MAHLQVVGQMVCLEVHVRIRKGKIKIMRLYGYVITRDFGFAPNPYYGICTLATCKPKIRKTAEIGDWVAGFGGSATLVKGRLVYIMRISEKIAFDDYWNGIKFDKKKPNFLKSRKACYGDNIYHHDDKGEWIQENSHHSFEDEINYKNLYKDTSEDAVLISEKFWYFGNNAPELPSNLDSLKHQSRGHKIAKDQNIIIRLIDWLENNFEEGINGRPFSLIGKKSFLRFAGDR